MTANSVSSVVLAVQCTTCGVPLSYQMTVTRTNLNPPPPSSPPPLASTECGGHAKTTDFYHHQKGSIVTRQKSLIWWTCRRLAKLEESSRCTLSLTEETSSFNEVFASRRITSKPNCFFSSLCTLSTDEVSSVSDMYTWNVSLISQDSNMSTNTSDFLHAT